MGEAPPLPAGAGCGVVLLMLFGSAAIVLFLLPLLTTGLESGQRTACLVFGAMFAFPALIGGLNAWQSGRHRAHVERLRAEGSAGRATVRAVLVGQGQRATLELDVEVGGNAYRTRHHTLVPMLLVPRLVDGFPLPVLVDPTNPSELEIQWHLV